MRAELTKEPWCIEAEAAEEARELRSAGAGYRCAIGDCVNIEVEAPHRKPYSVPRSAEATQGVLIISNWYFWLRLFQKMDSLLSSIRRIIQTKRPLLRGPYGQAAVWVAIT